MFYLKDYIIKLTPLACFIVKYLGHECNMDMPVPLPDVCGWCGYPVITAVGPFLLLSDPGGPLAPFCPVWPGAG